MISLARLLSNILEEFSSFDPSSGPPHPKKNAMLFSATVPPTPKILLSVQPSITFFCMQHTNFYAIVVPEGNSVNLQYEL